MDIKNQVKEVLSKFYEQLSTENLTESSDTSAKVWSASELSISSREVGGKVEIVDAQGQKQSAPDGTYKMEDGFEFVVKDGQIESIVGEDAPAEEVKAEDVPADTPVAETPELDAVKTAITEINSRLDAMDELIKTITGNAEQKASEANAFSNQLNDLTEALKVIAKIPNEVSKINTSNTVKDTYEQRKSELIKLFSKK